MKKTFQYINPVTNFFRDTQVKKFIESQKSNNFHFHSMINFKPPV